jgi:hypothetical protein
MSIIHDALKKADYLRKWKTVIESSHVTEPSAESAVVTETAHSAPGHFRTTLAKAQEPPFRVHFDRLGLKSVSFFQLSKLALLVLFLCGLVVLLMGPWIYMWTGQGAQARKTETLSAPNTSATAAISQPIAPSAKQKPIQIIESTPAPAQRSFKEYSAPNVRPSVRPIPRSMQNPAPESIYKLSGITILGETDRFTIINGKVYEVGGKVGDAEVVSIEDKQVVLKRGNKTFSLFLE